MKYERMVLNKRRKVYLERYQLSVEEELSNIQKRPAVLVLPGGGYKFHSEREGEPVALAYMAQGYNAFVLRYSAGPDMRWPEPLEDAEQALQMIRENADDWQIDSEKICTVGFSAGAHLSVAVSAMGRERPNAEILGYPAILERCVSGLGKGIPALDTKINSKIPPTFVYATMADEIVPIENSLMFAKKLKEANVPSEFHIYMRGCHGQSLSMPHISNGLSQFVHPEIQGWFEMSMNFLRTVFGDFPLENLHPHWKLVNGGLLK